MHMPAFRPRAAVLFLGDICFFISSIWVTLFLRAFVPPSRELFLAHLAPFSLLFLVWILVFFIAGLYESRTIILQRSAFSVTLLVAQTFNIIIAAVFFFFIPVFGIEPKTILLIYLVVSFFMVLLWRVVLFPKLGLQRIEPAIVVGSGSEINELVHALRSSRNAPTRVVAVIEPNEAVAAQVKEAIAAFHPRFVIADFNSPNISGAFPELYNYLSQGIRFVDAMTMYEDVFGRVPLSVIDDRWIARNVSRYSHVLYDSFKRVMDVVIALPVALVSLIVYPFILIAIKIEDSGPAFIVQERIGEENKPVRMYKFRSMTGNDSGKYGKDGTSKLTVTRVGHVLRTSRLDELPQLWDILRGDFSLIGPRPELPTLVALYEKEIPYYGVRHLIKPGLSGWAQLYHDNHPHHGSEVEATREKLSYDLYYLKHRSLLLDLTIALKTIKKLLTRSGV